MSKQKKTAKRAKKASSKGSVIPSGSSPTIPLRVKQKTTIKTEKATPQIAKIMREMKVLSGVVDKWIKRVLIALSIILGIGMFLLLCRAWIAGSIFCGVPGVVFLFALTGLITIQPEKRVIVEFLGKVYCIKKSGLRWVCPFLMKKRAIVYTWKQAIRLFPDRTFPDGVHIDFKNGGKAELVEPILWVQLFGVGTAKEDENVLKTIYSIGNWRTAIQEGGEDALRTCLNNLTVDDALSATHGSGSKSWWSAVEKNFPDLEKTINRYGYKVKGLTISDFNWDAEVVKLRQEVLKEERSKRIAELSFDAAKKEVEQKALETGGLCTQIAAPFEAKGMSPEDAITKAAEIFIYQLGAKSGSIVDVRGGGSGELLSFIVAAAKTFQGQKSGTEKGDKE